MDNTLSKNNVYCFGVLSLVGIKLNLPPQVDMGLKIATGVAALVVAFFAIRAHIWTIKEKKAIIKKIDDEKRNKQDV